MAQLDEILALDATAFTSPDQMPGGEAVTYKPNAGGTRSINANVFRNLPVEIIDGERVLMPSMFIDVVNSATLGILITEIVFGGDKVSVAYVKGGTAADHPIVGAVLTQDAGMIRLALG